MRRRAGNGAVAVLVGLTAAATSGCLPAPPGWEVLPLTRDGDDVVTMAVTEPADTADLAAPSTNRDVNTRVVIDRADAPLALDQTSCARVWSPGGWPAQEGIALRIRHEGTTTRAITVTRNVWGGPSSIYNVHLWGATAGTPDPLAKFDLFDAVDGVEPTTPETSQHLCGRVRGLTLEVKVWPHHEPEPAWGDPDHSRSIELPPSALYGGRPGWYCGHLRAGATMAMAELSATSDDPPGTVVK